MSLAPFLAISFGAAAAALLTRRWPRLALAIGLAGLILATIAALAIVPGERLTIGAGQLQTTDFGRLYLVLGLSTGFLIVVVGLATAPHRHLPAALLGGFGALGLAFAIGDPIPALIAVLAGALVGTLVTIVPPVSARTLGVAAREFRAIAVAGAVAIVGVAWIDRPLGALSADPTVFGLAFLAVGLATALRFGAIPFHRWAARLSDSAPEVALPLLLAWAPAGFAVVALAWMDRSVAPLLLPLGAERGIVVAVAVLTITLGAVAAVLQDDLEHVVGYSILQDAGFIILGLAVLDPAAWQPTRTWILIFVVVKTAFAAWAVALRTRFDTRRIPELSGWARRAPGLAVALLLIVIATIGVPGLLSWDVRSQLVDLSLTSGPMSVLVTLGGLASLAYYGRIALAGGRIPSTLVAAGRSERPRRAPTIGDAETSTVNETRGPTVTAADPRSAETTRPVRGRRPSAADGRLAAGAWVAGLARLEARSTRGWNANRAPIATALVLVLALIGLSVGLGGLGGPAAAAASAPEPGAPTETFLPNPSESPEPSSEPTTAAPSTEPSTPLSPAASGGSSPASSPVETASPSATPSPGAAASPGASGGASSTPSPTASPSPTD